MLSKEDNELITRVGPETPMGKMLRRYWIPACLISEVNEPDGDPVRVRLLGEDLLAFRDTNGRVGLIGERCPHRLASLFYGRNEECGIRCLYHGWKIDVDGTLLETPPEQLNSTLKDKLKHTSYPTLERGGVVWAYMGPLEKQPPFPDYEWTTVPDSNRVVSKSVNECNFIQSTEGALDTSHADWLHGSKTKNRPSFDSAPTIKCEQTPYGFRYGATRKPDQDPDKYKYVRVTLFAAPFHCFVPPIPPPRGYGSMHIFVPMDDEHTAYYAVYFSRTDVLDPEEVNRFRHTLVGVDLDENYRKIRRPSNNYLQDRKAMRHGENFTGIDGIITQDAAMQESMGPIVDRTQEHLAASDTAVIFYRRTLLNSVKGFMEGKEPTGLDPSFPYHQLRSDAKVIPIEEPWESIGAFAGEFVKP